MSRRAALLLCAIAFIQGSTYNLVVPLWQGPDEPGHFEVVRLWSEQGRFPQPGNASFAVQQDIIGSLARAHFWSFTRRDMPTPLPNRFADDDLLRQAGTQIGRQPATYYVVPSLLVRLTSDTDTQARLVRWFSVLLSVLAVWAAAQAGQTLFADEPLLAVGIPALLALGPMPAFIGSIINNDVLANLSGALFWWALARWFRDGTTVRQIAPVIATLALALVSKRTTWFLLPTALAAGLIYTRMESCFPGRRLWLIGWPGLVALSGAVLALALWQPLQAADWRQRPDGGMASLSHTVARSGHYGLQLHSGSARQTVAAGPLRGQAVTLTAWVQGNGRACIGLDDEHKPVSVQCAILQDNWQPLRLAHTVHPSATLLHASITLDGTGVLAADDAILQTGDGANRLRNGRMEARASALAGLLDRIGWTVRLLPDTGARLWNPASYDGPSLARYGLYVALTFAGFWGNFGWLQWPLSLIWYEVLALICLVSAAGWFRLALGKHPWSLLRERHRRAVMVVFGVGIAFALLQTFLPMIGRAWQPQGRYLFPALVPIAAWVLAGLGAWTPSQQGRQALLIAWLAGLFLLNAVALVETIYPFYHPPLPGQRVF